jgi:hypothetical protein
MNVAELIEQLGKFSPTDTVRIAFQLERNTLSGGVFEYEIDEVLDAIVIGEPPAPYLWAECDKQIECRLREHAASRAAGNGNVAI